MIDRHPVAEEHLYERIAAILDDARSRVARTVNTAMVHAYWLIGREIVEVEQAGAERARYGEGVVKGVAARLTAQFGKGFSLASLKRMKQWETHAVSHTRTAGRGGVSPSAAPTKTSTKRQRRSEE